MQLSGRWRHEGVTPNAGRRTRCDWASAAEVVVLAPDASATVDAAVEAAIKAPVVM
jgi:hypothetical protein